jgi:hypothetical protein
MVKMSGGKMAGGNITPLSGADINSITSGIGGDFKAVVGSGNPRLAAANIGLSKMANQVAVDMEAGGQKGGSSITVDCPSVVGATPQQQASTCALFKTGAETGIQTRLFNQGGGKRRNKTHNRYRVKKRTRSKRVKRSSSKRVKRRRNTREMRVHRRRKLSR